MTGRTGPWNRTWQMRTWYLLLRTSAAIRHLLHPLRKDTPMTETVIQSAEGLDVSNFQGKFDWQGAKQRIPGLAFGISRASQGLGGPGTVSPDPDISWDWQQIKAEGLHRGAYHFLAPHLGGTAQAAYFVAILDALGLDDDDMLWLDNETGGPPADVVAACARDFMAELVRLRPDNPKGVYTFIDFAREGNCHGLGKYDLWLAYPASKAPVQPPPWLSGRFRFWQWGLRDGADADAFMGTAADLDAWIDSFAPKGPPYRHLGDGRRSLGSLAKARATTAAHLIEMSAANYTDADMAALEHAPLPRDVPWYSSTP